MHDAQDHDNLLVHASGSLEKLLTRFDENCVIVSKAEFEAIAHAEELLSSGHNAISEWRHIIRRMNLLPSDTIIGIAAKGRALQCCIKHHLPMDEDILPFIMSLTADIDRIIHPNPDPIHQYLLNDRIGT